MVAGWGESERRKESERGKSGGVQIQSNPIKTAKSIQSKSKIDQNRKSLDWIGFYFSQTAWIGSDFWFKFQNRSNPIRIE